MDRARENPFYHEGAMKPIKVKAWDKVQGCWAVVEAISFHHFEGTPQTIKVAGKEWAIGSRFELVEWTGMLDANDKEIYTGDLVSIQGRNLPNLPVEYTSWSGIVRFGEDVGAYYIECAGARIKFEGKVVRLGSIHEGAIATP